MTDGLSRPQRPDFTSLWTGHCGFRVNLWAAGVENHSNPQPAVPVGPLLTNPEFAGAMCSKGHWPLPHPSHRGQGLPIHLSQPGCFPSPPATNPTS